MQNIPAKTNTIAILFLPIRHLILQKNTGRRSSALQGPAPDTEAETPRHTAPTDRRKHPGASRPREEKEPAISRPFCIFSRLSGFRIRSGHSVRSISDLTGTGSLPPSAHTPCQRLPYRKRSFLHHKAHCGVLPSEEQHIPAYCRGLSCRTIL